MKMLQNIARSGLLFSFLSLSVSCGGSKACNKKLVAEDCPSDGKCSVIIHKDKAMVVTRDEFGKPRYEMQDNTAKNVVIYTYDRNVPENTHDGSYREEIALELDKNQQSAQLSGKKANNGIKALFGRFCYCKGSTGYYEISEGNLTLLDTGHQNYTMDFKITEVPQIIQKIQFSTK